MPDLRNILTPNEPLGPSFTEPLIEGPHEVFEQLYDRSSRIHEYAHRTDPTYIVGRKGAGKTAFLVGTALVNGAEVILVKSEDVYSEVEKLRKRYTQAKGLMFADNLAHVWNALLTHAAMLLTYKVPRLRNTTEGRKIAAYLSAYGNPGKMDAGELLARVGGALSDVLVKADAGLTVDEACRSLSRGMGTYESSRIALRELLARSGNPPYVMVDNLEDLHVHIDDLRITLAALFRCTRNNVRKSGAELPFRVRLAFPAELLRRLRDLTVNPEKDFLNYLVIRWTAADLVTLAGNRVRQYLELYFADEIYALNLPRHHDESDTALAERTLRSVLPPEVSAGLGVPEDPVAYIMRHTQLLPRHLIQILNEILRWPSSRRPGSPKVRDVDVLSGVKEAELRIVEGVLSSYSLDHPYLSQTLDYIKNHIPSILPCSEMHRIYNNSGAVRGGLSYDAFLEAALEVGVFGVIERSTERYTIGKFSYTFAQSLRPLEDSDSLCVHPLFMYRLFDTSGIGGLRKAHVLPVYPYGSDPGQMSFDV